MRRSPRLDGFDCSTPAADFVTITTHDRAALFGVVTPNGDAIELNAAARMVQHWWAEAPQKFPSVTLDARCVMPDHVHALLYLNCTAAADRHSLSNILQWFKSVTTVEYLRGVRERGWPAVRQHLWQRSFYDRIVRNEREFNQIRWYIESNPGSVSSECSGDGSTRQTADTRSAPAGAALGRYEVGP